ncbi:MAG: calcium/sodium antiporter [Bacteroidales bacterium]
MDYAIIAVSLSIILFGADWLVNGASQLASRFGLSEMMIGLTVVAIGTSMPELTVNIFSAINGFTDLAMGNVIGSNMCNTLLVLGVTALIKPINIERGTKFFDIPFNFFVVLLLLLFANDMLLSSVQSQDLLSRSEGAVLILFLLIFIVYSYKQSSKGIPAPIATENTAQTPPHLAKSIGLVLIGLTGLVVGGDFLVSSAVNIATNWGVSEKIIGLTIVAIGTSLPELATSVVATLKGKTAIAVGNIMGSNIFNVLFVLGTTAVVHEMPISTSNLDILMMLVASLMLIFVAFGFSKNKIARFEGGFFLVAYIAYLIFSVKS